MYASNNLITISSSNSISPSRRPAAVSDPSRFASASPPKVPVEKNLQSRSVDTDEFASKRGSRGGKEKRISGIHVPREKYIPIPKGELLDGILSSLFASKEDADDFARFYWYLDSILHAEHKFLLEELRLDYSLTTDEKQNNAQEETERLLSSLTLLDDSTWNMRINGHAETTVNDNGGLECNEEDMRSKFGKNSEKETTTFNNMPRVDVAANFQLGFMKLLRDAKFEEISANDLLLTRTLKTDYLLTLPIYVDWKKALESNAVIFRRGYATERQNGLLIVEKLDYLQSEFLKATFSLLSKPSKKIGIWFSEALNRSNKIKELNAWVESTKIRFTNQSLIQNIRYFVEERYNNQVEDVKNTDKTLPIWIAAQKAVPLYEGFLSSVGPRGRLMRKLLTWTGSIPSTPEVSFKIHEENKHSEVYLRPNFLPRVTLSDIWRPATNEYCGNNLWEKLKTGFSILFSKSLLEEPAFQELILLYTDYSTKNESQSNREFLPLNLKIYENIPIPDLPVIFPHRKLSFRILDTIRLDIASILGLLAFLVNYKFETIISTPSAFLLDLVAVSALVLYAIRVVLGYKQTWDRYQLLVNRTLYEKTLASGFGSVHFLLDASEQQQHKEAILAYALVLHSEKYETKTCHASVKDACERFLFEKFGEKVDMPIESGIETLMRLGIVNEYCSSQETLKLESLPCSEACDVLKQHWDKLLQKQNP